MANGASPIGTHGSFRPQLRQARAAQLPESPATTFRKSVEVRLNAGAFWLQLG